ncbi:hypothetical protein NHQ30_003161 [Ciborinia camelliae]|nr:hypothetical protein NHQ30_003161 [Ciborinia camelliae]
MATGGAANYQSKRAGATIVDYPFTSAQNHFTRSRVMLVSMKVPTTTYRPQTKTSQDEIPFAKTKKERMEELTETLFIPTMTLDVKKRIETLNNCKNFLNISDAYRNRHYIHTFTEKEVVPYEKDPDTPQARGSFGVVYKAVNRKNGAVSAVKQLRQIYSTRKRQTIIKELGLLERCNHPNLLTLMDAYQMHNDPHTFYLVTQPWAPYTLSIFIHRADIERQGSCPWFAAKSIPNLREKNILMLKGLSDSLGYLHENSIKHKDIKPDNILLHDEGPRGIRPIIADFGETKTFLQNGSTNFPQHLPISRPRAS